MTLVIENASEKLAKAIKNVAKLDNTKVRVLKDSAKKGGGLREAIKQVKRGEVISYDSFEDFKKDVLSSKKDSKKEKKGLLKKAIENIENEEIITFKNFDDYKRNIDNV